jgi:hypothetical protein
MSGDKLLLDKILNDICSPPGYLEKFLSATGVHQLVPSQAGYLSI